jgi:hypothetical protein
MDEPTVDDDAAGAIGDDVPALAIECGTCVATGTTACTDCVVSHLIANDDGPIEYVTVALVRPRSAAERAVERALEMFRAAGLVDDPVELVDPAEFEHGAAIAAVPVT